MVKPYRKARFPNDDDSGLSIKSPVRSVLILQASSFEEDAMRPWQKLMLPLIVGCGLGSICRAESAGVAEGKAYRFVDGTVDAQTYNGYRRYHAACNHCHGPDGMGSTVAGSLIDKLPDLYTFRKIVQHGVSNGNSTMKGFTGDPNIAPYIDSIYAYLQARADGALTRGRPAQPHQ